ncbi:Helix-turn-helix domain-containing protein [Paenibacillus sophorae]|uniref:Helix-turn-helix domain-containing protein n=1 Tax=Paenibacillus sophorae TaxID=1333845 RepID=A0A1H8H186_9BACL|nr:helix-turn-helix domain-containing protein [Paenibacillus sophorae]QWU14412.1 helix-turn-helix domain-containing protein [Paenibacillus sophorae]SEN50006.1 Helix-turn-helix domain-containing protein [Paenibacillus sophorae]
MTNNNTINIQQLNNTIDSLMSQLMTTEEASTLWSLSQDHIKRLCSSGKVVARKRGKTWLILKGQSNPAHRE